MEFWQRFLLTVVIMTMLWLMVTNAIFQLSTPMVTQTEAFLHIPRTVMLDFKP